MTWQHHPQPRVWYFLMLENGRSKAGVYLDLTKEIMVSRRHLVTLEENAGRSPAALREKRSWMNNLTKKDTSTARKVILMRRPTLTLTRRRVPYHGLLFSSLYRKPPSCVSQ
jgi:hypothetical protein